MYTAKETYKVTAERQAVINEARMLITQTKNTPEDMRRAARRIRGIEEDERWAGRAFDDAQWALETLAQSADPYAENPSERDRRQALSLQQAFADPDIMTDADFLSWDELMRQRAEMPEDVRAAID